MYLGIRNLYNDMLLTITRGGGKEYGSRSNAKPIFMLSIIECIAMKYLQENRLIYDDYHLKSTYKAIARFYNEEDVAPMLLPFFHLHTSPFYHLIWHLSDRPSYKHTHPSGKYLKEFLNYAKLDEELWDLLQDAENRDYFKRSIVNRFLNK